MLYSYIFLQKIVLFNIDNISYVGWGFVLDWLDRENLEWNGRKNDVNFRKLHIKNSILTPPPLAFKWIFYFLQKTSR